MTLQAHRHGDARTCGAATVVTGQSTVFTNGRLASVDGDPNTHGDGQLIARSKNVYINGKLRVIVTNDAVPDDFQHPDPAAASGSPDVYLGEG